MIETEPEFVLATCSDPRVPYVRYARALGARVMPALGADIMPDERYAVKYLQRYTHDGKVTPLVFAAHTDCLVFGDCGGDIAARDRAVEQAAYMRDAGVPSAAMMFRHGRGPEFMELNQVWNEEPSLQRVLNQTRSLAFDDFDWSYDPNAAIGAVVVGSAFQKMEYPRVLRLVTRAVRREMFELIARAIAHFRESLTDLRLYISPEVSRPNADRVTAFFADMAVFPAECRQAAA